MDGICRERHGVQLGCPDVRERVWTGLDVGSGVQVVGLLGAVARVARVVVGGAARRTAASSDLQYVDTHAHTLSRSGC